MDFFPDVVFTFSMFGQRMEVTESVTVTWIIMAVFGITAFLSSRNLKVVPRGFQNIVEIFVESTTWLVDTTMGTKYRGFVPYIGTLTLYLTAANLIGLITLRPPTADLSTTLALSTITFALTQYYGIKVKGMKNYLKGFIEPIPFMLPLNIIGELANPFSMAFRLFGNILGGFIILTLLYRAAPILLPVPLHAYFDVFAGVLQTFIFSMLTMTFLVMAMD
ncbi:MAG: F-type H+-transporting ATPase subunit a [Thermosediminibacterales bacterium]|nr:F-type H+-transporting ATPase subunit a [Thermosediminibacterales bacterium]MDK2836015.1 F-type H+-transporting ATPase subunit a [Thermosediminibacterales bacterium]